MSSSVAPTSSGGRGWRATLAEALMGFLSSGLAFGRSLTYAAKNFYFSFSAVRPTENLKRRWRMLAPSTMRVCVGHISARCERCGGEDFQPALGEPSPTELICFACGLPTTRRALLM
jgi:hypothetical protein